MSINKIRSAQLIQKYDVNKWLVNFHQIISIQSVWKKKKKILFKVEQNCKYNTSEFAITSTSHTICTTTYTIFTTKYTNEKKISCVQNIKLMIINISIHDHRFDIRHWAQNPQLHVGPFHNFNRFLNASIHCSV